MVKTFQTLIVILIITLTFTLSMATISVASDYRKLHDTSLNSSRNPFETMEYRIAAVSIDRAADGSTTTPEDIIDGATGFIEAGEQEDNPLKLNELKGVSDTVYNILLVVGIIAAVITGLILAIKIMAGSVTEKAEYKQMLIPYIVGCVVVFGAFTIWKIVVELLNQTQ